MYFLTLNGISCNFIVTVNRFSLFSPCKLVINHFVIYTSCLQEVPSFSTFLNGVLLSLLCPLPPNLFFIQIDLSTVPMKYFLSPDFSFCYPWDKVQSPYHDLQSPVWGTSHALFSLISNCPFQLSLAKVKTSLLLPLGLHRLLIVLEHFHSPPLSGHPSRSAQASLPLGGFWITHKSRWSTFLGMSCPVAFAMLCHNFQFAHLCHPWDRAPQRGTTPLVLLVTACVPLALPGVQSLSSKYLWDEWTHFFLNSTCIIIINFQKCYQHSFC